MPETNLTEPVDPNQEVIGYIVNSGLSETATRQIQTIQNAFDVQFPGAIWPAPEHALHITLLDWIAPLVDYGQDKDELFQKIRGEFSEALQEAIDNTPPIRVHFASLEAFPAAIIIRGSDDGSYQRIRDGFMRRVELPYGTKQPPQIIHSTVIKFMKPIDVEAVRSFSRSLSIDVTESISEFRLARESLNFMQRFETIQTFALG